MDFVGIAVSGGPDSMALAYLCRQLQVTRPDLDLDVKAFVVDHRFREESTEEALLVAKWLSKLGLSAFYHSPYINLFITNSVDVTRYSIRGTNPGLATGRVSKEANGI